MDDEHCPWCAEHIQDLWEFFSTGCPRFDCPHCGKPIDGDTVTYYMLEKGTVSPTPSRGTENKGGA